jgi:hypothetical protein
MQNIETCHILNDICPEQNTECMHCCLYVIHNDFLRKIQEIKEIEIHNPELLQEVTHE